jgi:hypothetical protein
MANQHYNNIPNNFNNDVPNVAAANQEDVTLATANMFNEFARLAPALGAILAHVGAAGDAQHTEAAEALQRLSNLAGQTVQATQRTRERVRNEDKIPIFTQIPAVPGQQDNLPGARDYKIDTFTGAAGDKVDCLTFLRQICDQATASGLSRLGTKRLISRHTTGEASQIVQFALKDNADLEEVCRRLETRFAGLVHPEVAMVKCQNATRQANETLTALGQRIRAMAQMATRDKPNAQQQLAEEVALAHRVFKGLLPPQVRQAMDAKENIRLQSGKPAWDYTAYVNMAADVETQVTIYRQRPAAQQTGSAGGSQRAGTTFLVDPGVDTPVYDSIQESQALQEAQNNKQAAELPQTDLGMILRVVGDLKNSIHGVRQEVQEVDRRARSRERRSAGRRGNTPSGDRKRSPHPGSRGNSLNRIHPADVNVRPDECMKCGIEGHLSRDKDLCPLASFTLTDKPCPRCKKGGHVEKVCMRFDKDLPKN